VPELLFLDGHAYELTFSFEADSGAPVLNAVLTETNLALGRLSLTTTQCSYLRLSATNLAVVLDASAGTVPAPAGSFSIEDCLLDLIPGQGRQPSFVRCDRAVIVEAGETNSLQLGPPLRNTVKVTRDRNLLKLTYQVLGTGDEQYEYYNWMQRPRFSVDQAGVRIGSGTLPFG